MSLPQFTPEEQFVVSILKSTLPVSRFNALMWGYLVSGSILGGVAMYYSNIHVMAISLILIVGFRLYEEWYQSRWQPVYRSVVMKYESALIDNSKSC
jgi:hypothetical protein